MQKSYEPRARGAGRAGGAARAAVAKEVNSKFFEGANCRIGFMGGSALASLGREVDGWSLWTDYPRGLAGRDGDHRAQGAQRQRTAGGPNYVPNGMTTCVHTANTWGFRRPIACIPQHWLARIGSRVVLKPHNRKRGQETKTCWEWRAP